VSKAAMMGLLIDECLEYLLMMSSHILCVALTFKPSTRRILLSIRASCKLLRLLPSLFAMLVEPINCNSLHSLLEQPFEVAVNLHQAHTNHVLQLLRDDSQLQHMLNNFGTVNVAHVRQVDGRMDCPQPSSSSSRAPSPLQQEATAVSDRLSAAS
jgi:hypothetical protein